MQWKKDKHSLKRQGIGLLKQITGLCRWPHQTWSFWLVFYLEHAVSIRGDRAVAQTALLGRHTLGILWLRNIKIRTYIQYIYFFNTCITRMCPTCSGEETKRSPKQFPTGLHYLTRLKFCPVPSDALCELPQAVQIWLPNWLCARSRSGVMSQRAHLFNQHL